MSPQSTYQQAILCTLATCALHPSIDHLSLDADYFDTLTRLSDHLCNLRRLSHLSLRQSRSSINAVTHTAVGFLNSSGAGITDKIDDAPVRYMCLAKGTIVNTSCICRCLPPNQRRDRYPLAACDKPCALLALGKLFYRERKFHRSRRCQCTRHHKGRPLPDPKSVRSV